MVVKWGSKGRVALAALALTLPFLAAAGTALGLLAGVWLGYILVGAMQVGGFALPCFFPYAGVLLTVAVGLLMGAVGALIPARQAARLEIVTALRYE